MNANFFKLLEAGSVELTRNELKETTGGFSIPAAVAIRCGDGNIYTCSGNDCTGQDNVGCSCDGGAQSVSCADHPKE
ncbi:hypothetical protein [uncultured Aquimarina sp.]|uniref:hypothetical protein n=1 Tax=uncultured Aquimarina sp. TaxID=575652 RepID=UPI002611F896|nr:hypothetical protein [uncultured Aquimarina sp.]